MTGLELRNVTVRYGSAVGVEDVSLDAPKGRIVALLGPSGSGKSTLLRAIAGIEAVTAGSITFDGDDVVSVPVHRRGFALMFQDGQLFENRSVARNVGYGLRLRRTSAIERSVRVAELLNLVGLADLAQRMPDTLSGGQRQRVALARALAVSPRLLLLDEPLSSLDRSHREELATQLRAILTRAGAATVLVTHDHEEAFAIADDLVVMRDGRVVQSGPIAEVWRSPADAWVAKFLGYPTVLTGAAAQVLIDALPDGVGRGWSAVALRRSALQAQRWSSAAEVPRRSSAAEVPRRSSAAEGGVSRPGVSRPPLHGVVLSARAATDVLRLIVAVEGIGDVPAVMPSGSQIDVGDRVVLTPSLHRMAGLQAEL